MVPTLVSIPRQWPGSARGPVYDQFYGEQGLCPLMISRLKILFDVEQKVDCGAAHLWEWLTNRRQARTDLLRRLNIVKAENRYIAWYCQAGGVDWFAPSTAPPRQSDGCPR